MRWKSVIPFEKDDQRAFVKFVRLKYPDLIIDARSDTTQTVGYWHKKHDAGATPGLPDISIAEPRGGYHGFFLEMKRKSEKLKNKSGKWKSDTIKRQAEMLDKLRKKGYYAEFAVGYDNAVNQLELYLKINNCLTDTHINTPIY